MLAVRSDGGRRERERGEERVRRGVRGVRVRVRGGEGVGGIELGVRGEGEVTK